MLKPLARKIEGGEIGRINTPQVKWVIEETWGTCNSVLREDANTVTMRKRDHGETTSFNVNNIEEVVKFFRTQFDSIPETTYATGSEFAAMQLRRKPSILLETHKTKAIGQTFKHERTGESSEERLPKKVATTEQSGSKHSTAVKTTGDVRLKGGKSEEYKREKALGQPTDKEPYLCIFNLRYQYLGAKQDCKKGSSCDRDHFDRALKKTQGYRWTLTTLSNQINGAAETILKIADKKKLMEALREEFSSP